MHESLEGAWKLAEYVPKRHFDYATRQEKWQTNRSRRRAVPSKSVIHWSVYERGADYVNSLDLPSDVTRLDKESP
jgi:hypothetical protein